jgi:hypothetical protein
MYNTYKYNESRYNMLTCIKRIVRVIARYIKNQYDVKFEDGDSTTKHEG